MIDNREELYSILRGITSNTFHCTVDDYKNTKYPKITYQIKNNYDTDFRDGEACANISEYVVQVYEKVIQGNLVEVHKEVIDELKKHGYIKIFFDYFRDSEEDIHIYTFRFRKSNYY